MEVWKIVDGTEDKYEVSNLGNLRDKNRQRLVKGHITKYGYVYCNLRFNGKRMWVFRHRLVANAFLSKSNPKHEVNHINGIKTDNRVENLEWCDRSYNVQHAYDTGLKFAKKKGEHGKAKLVLDTQTGIYFDYIKDAAIAYNLKYSTLVGALNGRGKNNTNLIYA